MLDFLIGLLLAWLPAIIAERRKHRHALAVSIIGFASMWFHMFLWLAAILWAWKGPTRDDPKWT